MPHKDPDAARRYNTEHKRKQRQLSRDPAQDWKHQLWVKYRLRPEEYETMLLTQRGLCAICETEQLGQRLAVDHDHETGLIRGLLCNNCNRGIGLLRDDPRILNAGAAYLTAKSGVRGVHGRSVDGTQNPEAVRREPSLA